MEQHVMEGVTYEIVDVVDASSYARLNPDEEQGDVEYLELDMEVVEAVSDAAEYFSNAEDSPDEARHVVSRERPQPQVIQINGKPCVIKQEKVSVNGCDDRKRTASEASLTDDHDQPSEENNESRQTAKSDCCDSLDLFFQSMAQTVLHMPPHVQAKIKMEICKVISRAEIKYCTDKARTTNDL